MCFFSGHLNTYLVVFSLYLSITKKKKIEEKKLNKNLRKLLFILIKVNKGRGGVGLANVEEKFLSVNIINWGRCG